MLEADAAYAALAHRPAADEWSMRPSVNTREIAIVDKTICASCAENGIPGNSATTDRNIE